ncbi:histidinol-phosphatase [Aestuariivirga litoralis]|uniref:histidinol-phosphatase n=1 Tax=Aestuariivirga litoralis TaxID=2650924 RepID=UPI0018C7F58C|nr:histidinol-phosphatase [Aestuariivirga litoralis]MBG1233009.1 histidinol-phosphatase [Aestuariivirga litoralis]
MQQNTEIQTLTAFAKDLAHAAGEAILPHFRQPLRIDNKLGTGWDPVTEGDKSAERAIRALIEKHYPTHGIIGEEFGTKTGSSPYTWVLDPIDGTRAFVIGLPVWATLIGLYRDGEPIIGVMNQPYVGDMFYGNPDGAWLDHHGAISKITCAANKPLQQVLAGTTAPELHKTNAAEFERLRKSVQLMRYGGDAYFFSLLAAGHLDLALDAGLQIYDIAALIPIIRGAGGIIGCWDGKDESKGGNILAASSQALFDEASKILNGAA